MPEIVPSPLDPALDIADIIPPSSVDHDHPLWKFYNEWARAGMPTNATIDQGKATSPKA
jgi:hypothetical protein